MRTSMAPACNCLKRLVGAWRFELQTSCAQGRCATRLRYAPTRTAPLIIKHLPMPLLFGRDANDFTQVQGFHTSAQISSNSRSLNTFLMTTPRNPPVSEFQVT